MSDAPFQAGGPLPPYSPVYVERQADEAAMRHLQRMNYVQLTEPRQQGKTSLILRLRAILAGERFVFPYIDVSTLRRSDEAAWYTSLYERILEQIPAAWTTDGIKAPSDHEEFRHMLQELCNGASKLQGNIVFALDEVGSIPADWAESFFSVLREVFALRQVSELFQRLTVLLAGAFDPRDLIKDQTISPFNVSQRVSLPDFELGQIRVLANHLALPARQAHVVSQNLHHWTSGQPYVTQQLCLYLAEQDRPMKVGDAVAGAVERFFREDTNHLPRIVKDLARDPELLTYLQHAVTERAKFTPSINSQHFQLAHVIGIIKPDEHDRCQIRNRIYERTLISIYQSAGLERHKGEGAGQVVQVPDKAAPPQTVSGSYHDFEVLIGDQEGAGYPIRVMTSPAGQGEGWFTFPFAEDTFQAALSKIVSGHTDESFLIELGAQLFSALFTGDVRARYDESAGLTGRDSGLRIRLSLDAQPLQELPWELAHNPEKREFLVLSKRSLVTRYLAVPRPTPPLKVDPPLRILILVAAPDDASPIDADDEVARIHQALHPLLEEGMVKLSIASRCTKRYLRQRLLDLSPHVLHYIGHGSLAESRGVLLLEDQEGRAEGLDGQTLGTLLKGSGVQLAVLNTCLSAIDPSGPDLLTFRGRRAGLMGVGPALVDAGLGAVVAMQFPMADVSARTFAEDFYAMLARFKPVDECISRAREALLLEVGLDRPDWAAPVLFMRASDGVLFEKKK
jgi:hypothetical protein